jgi:PIN domain nuclease of toxin-antitoxin system
MLLDTLVAQAMIEGITLITADSLVAQYPGPIRPV